jgi:hypothetical protein
VHLDKDQQSYLGSIGPSLAFLGEGLEKGENTPQSYNPSLNGSTTIIITAGEYCD